MEDTRYQELQARLEAEMAKPRFTGDLVQVRIEAGMLLWDNDLQVVQVDGTMHANEYQGNVIQVWHNHTRGSSDDGRYGRLARRFPPGIGRDAGSLLPVDGETPEQWMARTKCLELHVVLTGKIDYFRGIFTSRTAQ